MANQNPPQNQNSFKSFLFKTLKFLLLLLSIQALANFTSSFFNKTPTKPYQQNSISPPEYSTKTISNAWKPNQKFDVTISLIPSDKNAQIISFTISNLTYNTLSGTSTPLKILKIPSHLLKDSNLKIKAVFKRSEFPSNFPRADTFQFSASLSLIKSALTNPEIYPSIYLNIVYDNMKYSTNRIPANLYDYIVPHEFLPEFFTPHAYFDTFWILEDELVSVTNVTDLEIPVYIRSISVFKWQMQRNMEGSMKNGGNSLMNSRKDFDQMKRILRDTNPYFLALTCAVTLLHFVFEVLAFKNNISFWKNKTDYKGLSIRSLGVELVSSIIISLYLLENETNLMIVVSSLGAIFIDLWKIKKVIKFQLNFSSLYQPSSWIKFQTNSSYDKSDTAKYDRIAIKYMSIGISPLLFCYGVYSFIYETHKSWYSFAISTLAGWVYTFGFITMCPQLYINYKLKSIAHLPWRMLIYKSLNTVIDDLFSFIIKMPMLHRLSCFRDDVVFAVYIYQWWKYRVDYSRVNEFGYSREVEDHEKNK